ncbi:MAG TPA: hypothetical protein VHS06_09970 [Chloroflexota bacterium]|nr:hypothetical protein [Chloroflexota bacterium]
MLLLTKDNSRLVLGSRSEGNASFTLAFTYRGIVDGSPRLEVACRCSGRTERATATLEAVADQSRLSAILPSLNGSPARYSLTLVDSGPDHIRLTVATPLAITCEEGWSGAGLSVLDVLSASEANTQLLSWLLRKGEATLPEIVEQLGMEEKECKTLIARLVSQSQVLEVRPEGGATSYRARLSRRKGRTLSSEVWSALEDAPQAEEGLPEKQHTSALAGIRRRLSALFTGERGRFLISLTPVILAFLFSEWALVTDSSSFTAVLNLLGVISVTIFVGIIPVLLILSSRRKGDMVPGFNYRVLGNPVLQGVIYVIFLAAILLHGLVIWQQPLEKAAALVTTAIVLGMTVTVIRRGALRSRAVIELRQDSGKPSLSVSAILSGIAVEAKVEASGLRETPSLASDRVLPGAGPLFMTVSLPEGGADELKLWAHRINEEGDSEPLAAFAVLNASGGTEEFDLRMLGGEAVTRLEGPQWDVEIKVHPGA